MIVVRQTEAFAQWLAALRDRRAKQRIADRILRIQGGSVGDVAPVGGAVSEARVHYGPGYRFYFVRRGEALIILLCGGDKSSQARDIAKAKSLANELE